MGRGCLFSNFTFCIRHRICGENRQALEGQCQKYRLASRDASRLFRSSDISASFVLISAVSSPVAGVAAMLFIFSSGVIKKIDTAFYFKLLNLFTRSYVFKLT